MGRVIEFGYWPEAAVFDVHGLAVRTLSGLDKLVAEVRTSERVHEGWFFSPCARYVDLGNDRELVLPFPERVFPLPKTHRLEVAPGQPDGLARFAIWCLGFFVGMRLTETEAGFLDATPIRPFALCDFVCATRELPQALEPAIEFFLRAAEPRTTENLLAAIHALWLSHTRNLLRFEQHHYAYVAIDALWRLCRQLGLRTEGVVKQNDRLATLADHLEITLPDWPSVVPERNNAVHEGLFYGQPLGFSSVTV